MPWSQFSKFFFRGASPQTLLFLLPTLLFQSTSAPASKCLNRKHDNVISTMVLRLQATTISGKLSNIYEKVVLVALHLRVLQVILEQQFLRLSLKSGLKAGKRISQELARL